MYFIRRDVRAVTKMNATEFRTDDEDKRNNGTVLQGELVALTWPDDHDYTKIERWLTPTSHAATLTGDTSETVTAETVREANRSEEHTSELQSRGHLVCRLLLEKKIY